MRKRRGLVIMLVGVALAVVSGLIVLGMARQAAAQASARPATIQAEPIKKVYVVVAEKDIPENVAVSAQDVSTKEFPADFAPAGAVAAPENAVGKFTTSRIYKGQILVAPQLAEARKTSQLSARVPEGKVAMAVAVNDSLNNLGALRPGDKVDLLLTLDMTKATPKEQGGGQQAQNDERPQMMLATQITMQSVEILAIGLPAGDTPTGSSSQAQAASQAAQQASKTITFLLNPQDAVTLKFIKDSGGTMDLVVRSPDEVRVFKTDAVTLDTIYKQFRFRFAEPIK